MAAACLLAGPGTARAAEAPWDRSDRSGRYVADEVVVRYAPGADRPTRAAARAATGAVDAEGLGMPGLQVVTLPEDSSVRAAAKRLERRRGVLYAEPNFTRRLHVTPNDPLLRQLWGLHNTGRGLGRPDADVDALQGWNTTIGSPDVLVAVIDTGANYNHPDLDDNIWSNPGESGGDRETNGVDDDGNGFVDDFRGWDFGEDDQTPGEDNDPFDLFGHGTHVAGTIAAEGDNGIGVVGVGWETTVMPLRGGDFTFNVGDSIQAIRYADMMGADVVNMSYGGWAASSAEREAIRAADDTLFAISAGNNASDNDDRPVYPCGYAARNVVCTAASTSRDRLAGFSNYGAGQVDLAAPGAGVLSTAWRPVPISRFSEEFEEPLAGRWRSAGPGDRWRRVTKRRRIRFPGLPPGIPDDPFTIKRTFLDDSPGGRYRNNANTWIRSPEISLSGQQGCTLGYNVSTRLERGYDILHVEGSVGSGWDPVITHTGTSRERVRGLELSEFTGSPGFRFRFRLETDSSGRDDGVHIDDVVVACRSNYLRASGTSMAAPHVAGAAALLADAFPAAGPDELRARLLSGVDHRPAFDGRVASDGRLNLARSLTQEDTRPPQTRILALTKLGRRARVRLESSEPLSDFECQVDGGPWSSCPPLYKTAPLAPGTHVIRAAATDFFGNEDPTPAVERFRIGG